jgi:DNA-binding Lrp family transcriptional regulator
MDAVDRHIIAALQGGFPLSHRPFRDAAPPLGLTEAELICRLRDLLDRGVLSRFGPLFNVEAMGGVYVLAAMAVPEDVFNSVAEMVNVHVEVAHNYEREHLLNMWFVVAAETPAKAQQVLDEIARETDIDVLAMPKLEEYYVGLRLQP